MQPSTRRQPSRIGTSGSRRVSGALLVICALGGLAGAAALPIYFESASLLYKFGPDKLLLLSAHVMGVVAGYLLLLQIILGARLKSLDRIFGLNTLFQFHRYGGLVLAGLVLFHPVLVFVTDDRFFIPLQWRYWPEFVGLFVWVLLTAMVSSSHWRSRLRFAFHRWRPFHRSAAILIVIAFWVHVYFVNETFREGIPLLLFGGGLSLSAFVIIWIRTRSLRIRRNSFSISAVEKVGKDALRLEIDAPPGRMFEYLPGQFSFITPLSPGLAREEHPFTIASTPTRPEALEFIIRTASDWTEQVDRLQPGDNVLLDGPFGRFSHLMQPAAGEMIMIAGGIGITPMLSMLRYMADHDDQRKITLIWSNRTEAHMVLKQEFSRLESKLRGLVIHKVFTRESDAGDRGGRLDRAKLKKLLTDCTRISDVFVCGPDRMIKDVVAHVAALGFPKRLIRSERFSL